MNKNTTPGNQLKDKGENQKESKKTLNRELFLSKVQLRENIKQINHNWVNTINAIDDVLMIVNTNFEIEDINTRGLELFNKKYEEVIGQKCYQNLLHNEQSCETCPICKSIRSSKHEMVEIYNDKTKSWYSIKSSPILDDKQEVVRYIDIIRDISKYKIAEKVIREKSEEISLQNEEYESLIEELRQTNDVLLVAKEKAMESDQLKSAFLANLSHEIRTPMNGIIGFSQMLGTPDISREKIDFYTNIIITSGHRLLSILNDILDISKIEAGQIEIKIEPASINNLIDELYDFYTSNRNKSDVFLLNMKGLTDFESIVYCDKTKVYQILNNLINNAIKFTEQGAIEFGYSLKSNYLEFYVQDSGIGIPPELQTVIFERFRQGDLELSRQCGGTGLGLSISQKLVEIMGGKIWLNSEPGFGSTFYFTLPYKPAQMISDAIEEENLSLQLTKSSAERNIILVAEDDEINFIFLKEILSDKYPLIHAVNGLEAINILKSNPEIKLILMDLKMPVMNGFEAIKIIKQQFPEIPIIAQTAYALQTEKDEVLKIGCTSYIAKPINKKLLIQLINNCVPV